MPKSSMAIFTPRSFSRRSVASARAWSLISTPLVISSSRRPDAKSVSASRLHEAGQIGMKELDRGQIDADLQRRGGFDASLARCPFADFADHAVLFGERDERARRHEAARRMIPTQQGLEAEHLSIDLSLRLVA